VPLDLRRIGNESTYLYGSIRRSSLDQCLLCFTQSREQTKCLLIVFVIRKHRHISTRDSSCCPRSLTFGMEVLHDYFLPFRFSMWVQICHFQHRTTACLQISTILSTDCPEYPSFDQETCMLDIRISSHLSGYQVFYINIFHRVVLEGNSETSVFGVSHPFLNLG
jgi:hypothetical protein